MLKRLISVALLAMLASGVAVAEPKAADPAPSTTMIDTSTLVPTDIQTVDANGTVTTTSYYCTVINGTRYCFSKP